MAAPALDARGKNALLAELARGADISERRRSAYRERLAEAGLTRRASWEVEGGWDSESGHRATARLLRSRSAVTASQ